ncbi:Hsp70 family protein [Aequorivita sediminis]|uniref:Hsp70 family protein n=1 Tax=Aequorivita sediminis TaxID=3073653 RepID=UPI0028AC25AE|nr:Hsp70 family protein [Aequorivita sp. F6058]
MKRTTVDFGIDLGTTNSAISKMENGNPESIRTQTLKDTMPSCVYINRRKAIQVGDAAFNALKNEKLNAMKNWDSSKDNSFIEFKRTMGSDAVYESSNAERSFSSIELSAEVLKTLKSFEKDENINSVIITVPAAFKNNQIDATREAGKEAGFDQVGIITEPEAAAWVYGMNSENKDGFWLVFDFGGGTFDAALLKVTDGIRQVIDTEGDNYLGGKNLDEAIVDEIILPYLKENFVIDELLEDNNKRNILRAAMKFYAEEIKKQLSFNAEASILTNLGDIPGEDDEGEEFELDFTVTETELEKAIGPVFQKAIDISNKLLERNNLSGDKLSALILVGGPTYSPILRRMLEQQICKPDTSVDPMTVVAKGASIYASTIKKDETTTIIDTSKIQLDVTYESTSVEEEEFVTMKILADKTEGEIPEKVFADISRDDGGWSSGKVEINVIGEIFTVQLEKGKSNSFTTTLYDDKGNKLECEPAKFNIIQGGKGGSAVLPHNIGIEIQDISSGRLQFKTVTGLEKSKQLPASGNLSKLKTPRQIRPGMDEDYLEISIYQGEHGCERSRAIHNHHVNTILITGSDLPSLLPENSEVDIEMKIDINQKITGLATFPHLAFTYEFECETKVDSVNNSKADYLEAEISKAKRDINSLKSKGIDSSDLKNSEKEIEEIENHFNKNKEAADTQQQTIENLRKTLKTIDKLIGDREWPELEKELKDAFHSLEEVNKKKGNEQTTKLVESIRPHVEQVIIEKDTKHAPKLIEEINQISFELERLEHLIGFIFYMDSEFDSINWRDRNAARHSIERGKSVISESPSIDRLQPIINNLVDNGDFGKGGSDGGPNVPVGGTLRG